MRHASRDLVQDPAPRWGGAGEGRGLDGRRGVPENMTILNVSHTCSTPKGPGFRLLVWLLTSTTRYGMLRVGAIQGVEMISTLVSLVIYILVLGLVAWLLLYIIDFVPVPEPFNRVAKIVIMIVCVLILILLLLSLVEGPGALRLPRL